MSLYERIKELEAVKGLCVTILSAKADADNEIDQSKPYYKELRTTYEACAIVDAPKIAEACLTLLNNLPSVLSALKGQEWLPIDEQAPQAWVRVLLYCPREAEPVLVGHWNPDFKAWVLDTSGEVMDSTGGCTFELHPTHFKPIGPESPVCQRCNGSGKLTVEGMPVKRCPDCSPLPPTLEGVAL